MRLALLSDIHGNLAALEAVIADFNRRGVDAVVNLGDSLSGPLLPKETAQLLMTMPWKHLAGNHERQLLTQKNGERRPSDEYARSQLDALELQWLAALSSTARLGNEAVFFHGTPESDVVYLLETVEAGGARTARLPEIESRLGAAAAPLIACGHSHLPRSVRTSSGQLVVNPGSVGLPAYVADLPHPHVMETGSPDARYAVVEWRRNVGWVSSLRSVPYDHRSMAALAAKRDRSDWARALASGYVR